MADSNSKSSAAKGTSGAAKPSSAAKSRAKPASASRATNRSSGTKRPASSNGRAKSSSSSNARAKTPRANGRAKPTSASGRASRSAASSRSSTPARTSGRNGSQNGEGLVGSVKQVAGKAKGPAIAVGAAAAGIAGGIVLKGRGRRRTVLGLPLPRHMASVDAKSLAKTVGEASARFAKTSKTVSRDLERAGDQAERIGKILK